MAVDGRSATAVGAVVKPEAVPALFEHARNVYADMLKGAVPDEDGFMVYTGHLTHLFRRLRLSVPYYTQIKNRLVSMGCIEQTKRGGGTATSKWILWKEPMLDEWFVSVGQRPKARGDRNAALEQRLRDMNLLIKAQGEAIVMLNREVLTLRSIVEGVRSGHNV